MDHRNPKLKPIINYSNKGEKEQPMAAVDERRPADFNDAVATIETLCCIVFGGRVFFFYFYLSFFYIFVVDMSHC